MARRVVEDLTDRSQGVHPTGGILASLILLVCVLTPAHASALSAKLSRVEARVI